MTNLTDKHLIERANTALLPAILRGALATCSKAGEGRLQSLPCRSTRSPNWLNS
jgi:hypothetical protein